MFLSQLSLLHKPHSLSCNCPSQCSAASLLTLQFDLVWCCMCNFLSGTLLPSLVQLPLVKVLNGYEVQEEAAFDLISWQFFKQPVLKGGMGYIFSLLILVVFFWPIQKYTTAKKRILRGRECDCRQYSEELFMCVQSLQDNSVKEGMTI